MFTSCIGDRILVGNNNKPSELSIQLMNSPCFKFICANCRVSTTSQSAIPCHSLDPLNMKSMEDLIIRVESSLLDLKKNNILILHLSSLLLIIFLMPHLFIIHHLFLIPRKLLQLKHMPQYSVIILHLQAYIINLHTFLFLLLLHLLLRIVILFNGICLF